MSWAAALLALSVVAWPRAAGIRMRAGLRPTKTVTADIDDDELADAASLDLLAACLRSGMAVSTAAAAVAPSAPAEMAASLRRAADLLSLGADPAQAWNNVPAKHGAPADRHAEAFLRMARRSAASGAALAEGIEDLAAQVRAEAADAASARAERASVLIAGPLGLCYLPAFLCLGVVPVLAGLAGEVLQSVVL